MSQVVVQAFGAMMMVLGTFMLRAVTFVEATLPLTVCPTGFANFGDSLTDTANACDSFPDFTDAENPPYGEIFFKAPAKRFSNGRLVPDFLSLAFRFPLLDAYFAVASFNYVYGVNFANAGATAFPFNPPLLNPFSLVPFQSSQFIRFQNSVGNSTERQPGCIFNTQLPLILPGLVSPLSNWLYTITIGGNDLLLPIEAGVDFATVNGTLVLQAVGSIVDAIEILYGQGARKFLISGIPAAGCSSVILTTLSNTPFATQTDKLGCNIPVNSIVQNFNAQLLLAIQGLRRTFTDASIAYFDYYSANIEILSNATFYKFDPTKTLITCCGAPGVATFNYNPAITCGHPGSNNCANPDSYIIWDGVHFTDAFYKNIAIFVLNGNFTDGGVNYAKNCPLDFSNFPSSKTFQQAYPGQLCNNLFT